MQWRNAVSLYPHSYTTSQSIVNVLPNISQIPSPDQKLRSVVRMAAKHDFLQSQYDSFHCHRLFLPELPSCIVLILWLPQIFSLPFLFYGRMFQEPYPINGQTLVCYHNIGLPSWHLYRRFQNSRQAFQADSWLFYQLYLYFQIDVPYHLYMP